MVVTPAALVTAAVLVAAAPNPRPTPSGSASESDRFLQRFAATSRFRYGRPNAIKLTPAGDAVLFLRSGPRSPVQDLFELDVASGRERVLLTAATLLGGGRENLTAEERARRERQRVSARGIASFELSEDGRRLLVPLGGRLFVLSRDDGRVRVLPDSGGAAIDARFSPDGSRVACVRNHDLHVIDVASGRQRRLTEGGTAAAAHGVAEFVAQEEMGRHEGWWWSPDGSTIAYQRTDASRVEVLRIADPAHPERPPQEWRYPRAGRTNAEVTLGLVSADGGPTTWVTWDRRRYPYLAAVTWTRNAPLTLLVQNRTQTEQALLTVNPARGTTRAILVERDAAWLNLFRKNPQWLADGRSFVWMTERAGAPQLELRARDGRVLRVLTPPDPGLRDDVALDEAHGMVWARASDDPTQAHVVQIPLGSRGRGRQVFADEPGLHGFVLAKEGGALVHSIAPAAGGPRWLVRRRDGALAGEIPSRAEAPGIAPRLEFTTAGDSIRCHAVLVRPREFDPDRRYPVIVSVYGGPHGQTVQAAGQNYVLQQWLADHGFIVLSIDGRGTPNRGRVWERAIRGDLIDVPLRDQVAALRALGRRYRELDLTRVGIYGWSFGGYFSVVALERYPAMFHAAVAGAPVTDWHDYDTHYTERYMGLPARNGRGYSASSALTRAKDLIRPLLILHGTADDNVYLLHSLKLCDALVRAGRSFEFVPLAGYTHMVADSTGITQVNRRILGHFTRHLGVSGAGRLAVD